MGTENATGAENTGNDTQTEAKAEKLFTQSEVNSLLARERRKLEERILNAENLAKELDALREEKRQAEESKLSATQRAELERKREREAYEKRIEDLEGQVKAERDRRHDLLKRNRAAEAVASVAAKLLNDKLAPTVQREIASRLVVEQLSDGSERLSVRMSDAAADLEPADTALAKLIDTEIAPVFFRAQGGSGAQHGNGAGGAGGWKHLSPDDRIAMGFAQRR